MSTDEPNDLLRALQTLIRAGQDRAAIISPGPGSFTALSRANQTALAVLVGNCADARLQIVVKSSAEEPSARLSARLRRAGSHLQQRRGLATEVTLLQQPDHEMSQNDLWWETTLPSLASEGGYNARVHCVLAPLHVAAQPCA